MIEDYNKLRRLRVGEPLRLCREACNLTQKHVADALSYSTAQFISNWERGVSLPPEESLAVLAKLFGVEWIYLVDLIFNFRHEVVELDRRALKKAHKLYLKALRKK